MQSDSAGRKSLARSQRKQRQTSAGTCSSVICCTCRHGSLVTIGLPLPMASLLLDLNSVESTAQIPRLLSEAHEKLRRRLIHRVGLCFQRPPKFGNPLESRSPTYSTLWGQENPEQNLGMRHHLSTSIRHLACFQFTGPMLHGMSAKLSRIIIVICTICSSRHGAFFSHVSNPASFRDALRTSRPAIH